jgi:hypothetical protein
MPLRPFTILDQGLIRVGFRLETFALSTLYALCERDLFLC